MKVPGALFAALTFAGALSGCTMSINEGTVFQPREPTERNEPLSISGAERLAGKATLRHERVPLAGEMIAVSHVTASTARPGAPLIVTCMGNASDRVSSGAYYAEKVLPFGDVLMFDYPGYGDSSGTADTATLVSLQTDFAAYVTGQAEGRPIIFWGHSLGGFVCAQMARSTPALDAIVLETTAANADEVAAAWKPWYLPFLIIRVEDGLAEYDTPAALRGFSGPVLVIGGGKDETLPVKLSRSLAGQLEAQGNDVTYLEYPDAGHYDAATGPTFAADAAPVLRRWRAPD
jgi:pimeloyl-ACP methyl ester carboxylesterase